MAGTLLGGKKASVTIKAKYGDDFYRRAGALGAIARTKPSGFASLVVGRDGLTGPQRAAIHAKINGKKRQNITWSDAHRQAYRRAIDRRSNIIGIEVDLSQIDLPDYQLFWYKAP